MKLEPTLYVLDDPAHPGKPMALIGAHVDDLLCACTEQGFAVLRQLERPFVIKTWDWDHFTYCGRQVQQLRDMEVQITMRDYCVKLETMKLSDQRKAQPESLLDRHELKLFRGLLGSLSWLAAQGRPDLSFQVSRLQAYGTDGAVQHVIDANALVRAAKRTEVILRYPPIDLSSACFVSVTDASFASMRQGRSQSGGLILLADAAMGRGDTGSFGLISWKSTRQKRACRPTVGAELSSLSDGVDAADFVRGLWSEIAGATDVRLALSSAPDCHWVVDCKDLFDSLNKDASGSTSTEKRLTLELIILKEFLSRGHDRVHWIATDQMLADSLTKAMPSDYVLARLAEAKWCFRSARQLPRSPRRFGQSKRSLDSRLR